MPIEKRWVVKPQGDSEAVAKLAAVLRISPVLAKDRKSTRLNSSHP